MINDKIITITKNNTFDKGWTIFAPYQMPIYKNRSYKEILVTDVVRAITKSYFVYIILKEPCLASAIVKELEWVSKFTEIELIAHNESIVARYQSIPFKKVSINPNLDFNYMSIEGYISLSVMINDGYTETSGVLKSVYFDGKAMQGDYGFLSDAEDVLFAGNCFDGGYDTLYNECIRQGKRTYRIITKKEYSQSVFNDFNKSKTALLLSDFTKDAVIYFTRSGEIKQVVQAANGLFLDFPISKLNDYVGELYVCLWQWHDKALSELDGVKNLYAWYGGSLQPYAMKDKLIIKRNISIPTMKEFVEESFDSSEGNEHNQYSAVAKSVEYQFTLTPPRFNASYAYSPIYSLILCLHKDFKKKATFDFTNMLKEKDAFFKSNKLGDFSYEWESFIKWFYVAVEEYRYAGYYNTIRQVLQSVQQMRENLLDIFGRMAKEVCSQSSETKFDKFDDEIAGYELQIEEKKTLIAKGVEVLASKRRIEVLERKIKELLLLKTKFEGSSSNRNSKTVDDFVAKCKAFLVGEKKTIESEESIGNVIQKSEETKAMKLEEFAEKWISSFNQFLLTAEGVLQELLGVDIPEDYVLYERDGKRFIVIDELQEYSKTQDLCTHFNAKCLARR
jgi:hypothetical protein